VRGNCVVSGVMVKPVEDSPHKCFCIRVVHMDPKGMIPPWIVALSKKRAGQSFETLRKLILDTYVPENEIHTKHVTETKGHVNEVHHYEEKRNGNKDEEEEEEREDEEEEDEFKEALDSYIPEDLTDHHRGKQHVKIKVAKTRPKSNVDLHRTLLAIQTLLDTLQVEIKFNGQRLAKIEGSLSATPSKTVVVKPSKIKLSSLGWDTLFVIFVWPFVALKLYQHYQQRYAKKS